MTQQQIDTIRRGLGEYAKQTRFVGRVKDKTPINPRTLHGAMTNDRSTWGTMEQAFSCVGKEATYKDGRGKTVTAIVVGIGVELGGGLCGIDLDHCTEGKGTTEEWALNIIKIMQGCGDGHGTYWENSPSGKGIHILFTGTIPDGARKKGNIEMYSEGRYFTLTGNGWDTVREGTEQAAQVHKKYLAEVPKQAEFSMPPAQTSVPPEDEKLLEIAMNARNGDLFTALFTGDWQGRYKSESEATIALLNLLAFYTKDAGQIDRLFRQSGLMREKWDRPQSGTTWGALQIQKAIADCRNSYQPGHRPTAAQDFGKGASDPWENPVPFDEYPAGPFTENTLPPCLENMAKASAASTQTPLSMNYAAVLAAAAITVQGKFKVQITNDYSEPLNLYIAAVAPPAERKSAVLRNATQALQLYEAQRNEVLRPEVLRSAAELDVLMRRQEDIKKKAAKSGDTGDLERISQEIAEFKQTKFERFICDDATPEALTSLMADNNGCIGLVSAEGGVFSNMKGRYRENGVSDIDVYLKAHSGDTIRIDRKSRPAEYINAPCLTMILMIQPVLIEGLMENDEFKGRGLTARFLYVVVDEDTSLVGSRAATAPSIPLDVKQTYERALFNRLNDRPQEAQPLYLSPEAEQHRQEFFNAIEPRLKNDLYFMSDWAGKLAGTVCRIAGILHCFSCPDPAAVQISGETMMNAIKLGFCFLQHAQAAYGAMGSDQTAAAAKYVLKRLNGVQSITKRNLHQLCRGRFKKVDELEPIITALIDHGYLRESTPPSEGAGRKPSPTYLVNPLLSQNTHNTQKGSENNERRK